MSLVMTATEIRGPSSRQSRAMSDVLPVPTGPQTPRRKARWSVMVRHGTTSVRRWRGTRPTPRAAAPTRRGCRRVRSGRRPGRRGVDGGRQVQQPGGRVDRVARQQLERRGEDRLHVVVRDQPRDRIGGQPGRRSDQPEDSRPWGRLSRRGSAEGFGVRPEPQRQPSGRPVPASAMPRAARGWESLRPRRTRRRRWAGRRGRVTGIPPPSPPR